MKYVLLFHGNSGYAYTPHFYVIRTLFLFVTTTYVVVVFIIIIIIIAFYVQSSECKALPSYLRHVTADAFIHVVIVFLNAKTISKQKFSFVLVVVGPSFWNCEVNGASNWQIKYL